MGSKFFFFLFFFCWVPCLSNTNPSLFYSRTGALRPTSGPGYGKRSRSAQNGLERHKRKPPRGMYINHDDIVALACPENGQVNRSDDLLASMDREVNSLLSQVRTTYVYYSVLFYFFYLIFILFFDTFWVSSWLIFQNLWCFFGSVCYFIQNHTVSRFNIHQAVSSSKLGLKWYIVAFDRSCFTLNSITFRTKYLNLWVCVVPLTNNSPSVTNLN